MTTKSRTQIRDGIFLPWPSRDLHPNARVHWAVKAKAVKAARMLAFAETRMMFGASADLWALEKFGDGRIHVWIDGYPKDRRRRDADGLLSSCKAYLDGIADALGIDDRRFVPHPWVKDELHKPDGQIRVRLTAGPEF